MPGKIGSTILLLTLAGVAGLVILNPAMFKDAVTLAVDTVTKAFRFASGKE